MGSARSSLQRGTCLFRRRQRFPRPSTPRDMLIMNCCDYCWQTPTAAADLRFPFSGCFPQTHFANPLSFSSDYVYNPKEARIRKAMRDQANRARNFHQQSQRQQQHHFHHLTHQQHNRHSLRMEPRNVTQARIGPLPDQTSSLNIQQNQKISHVLLSPHIVQHKPRHIQQVNHGAVTEGSQWMVGLNHRNAPQFSQQDLHCIQEQEMEKKRASIREQVEHGMVDSGFDFVVTGANNRENMESRGTSQINVSKGQEFDIFTDVDGHQHWYPRTPVGDGKEYNVTTENSWVDHQEQVEQNQQTHLQHENHNMKASEQQQLFSLPCLVETESSAQGKVEQNSHHSFQRIITIPTSEMQCNEEESFNGQQYIICSSTMTHPQVRFSIQPHSETLQSSTLNNVWQSHERPIHLIRGEKEEVCGQYFGGQMQQMEVTKEEASYRESFETSSTDSASSTVKVKNNISIPNHEEIGQRNPNLLPLPAFQQAFGSTEIGRFANEGFLSQVRVSLALPAPSYNLPIFSSKSNLSLNHLPHQNIAVHKSNLIPQQRLSQGMGNTFPCVYQHQQQLRPTWECQQDLPIRN